MWPKAILLLVLGLAVAITVAVFYGAYRWQTGTKELRTKLQAVRSPIASATYDSREIEGLPALVQRYFHAVLKDGQPVVASAEFVREGTFNMGETQAKWSSFASTQMVITQRPCLDWDGRISIAPGMKVFVHDAYVAGDGILHAALLGLVTLADIRGTPEAAQGELMRFFAEAAWYSTALLPSQGVRWEAIDDTSVRATLTDGATTVSLDFRFDAEGLISTVRALARYRTVNGALIATPCKVAFGRMSCAMACAFLWRAEVA